MGAGMVARLLGAGHAVRIWSRTPGRTAKLEALGARVVGSVREAFAGDALISMLPDDAALREIFIDGGGLPTGASNTVHVNMATVSVAFARELAAHHRMLNLAYVSAPVFGRAEAAEAGTLDILAAGEPGAMDIVRPLFECLGRRTWYLGDEASKSNVVKIAGNLLVACAIQAMGEAVSVCGANHVAAAEFLSIVTGSIFDIPVYKAYGARIAGQNFDPAGFKLSLGLKDVSLARTAGGGSAAALPFTNALHNVFNQAVADGDGDLDWSAIAATRPLGTQGALYG
jgi:3-hydroxyisobutyrate dehydrogenase-like beta-hydroxyacid dehydrogenase